MKGTSDTSRSNTACAGGTLAAPSRKPCRKVNAQVQLPRGYHLDWEGEYESEKRAQARLLLIVPLTDPGDFHHSLHHVPVVEMGGPDSCHRGAWPVSAGCSLCSLPTTTSVFPPVLAFWRCSAFPFKRASSCSNTSISFAREGTRSRIPRSKEPF